MFSFNMRFTVKLSNDITFASLCVWVLFQQVGVNLEGHEFIWEQLLTVCNDITISKECELNCKQENNDWRLTAIQHEL